MRLTGTQERFILNCFETKDYNHPDKIEDILKRLGAFLLDYCANGSRTLEFFWEKEKHEI